MRPSFDKYRRLFGGYGYLREFPLARMFTDSRIKKIYGGANEIMNDLVARPPAKSRTHHWKDITCGWTPHGLARSRARRHRARAARLHDPR
jgi:hypothetical protein